jgi:hypothetical protein
MTPCRLAHTHGTFFRAGKSITAPNKHFWLFLYQEICVCETCLDKHTEIFVFAAFSNDKNSRGGGLRGWGGEMQNRHTHTRPSSSFGERNEPPTTLGLKTSSQLHHGNYLKREAFTPPTAVFGMKFARGDTAQGRCRRPTKVGSGCGGSV